MIIIAQLETIECPIALIPFSVPLLCHSWPITSSGFAFSSTSSFLCDFVPLRQPTKKQSNHEGHKAGNSRDPKWQDFMARFRDLLPGDFDVILGLSSPPFSRENRSFRGRINPFVALNGVQWNLSIVLILAVGSLYTCSAKINHPFRTTTDKKHDALLQDLLILLLELGSISPA